MHACMHAGDKTGAHVWPVFIQTQLARKGGASDRRRKPDDTKKTGTAQTGIASLCHSGLSTACGLKPAYRNSRCSLVPVLAGAWPWLTCSYRCVALSCSVP